MFSISARLEANLDPNDLLHDYGLERGGRVQRFIDQKVISDCRPYIPASPDRTLADSAQATTELGSGLVIWNTPYKRVNWRDTMSIWRGITACLLPEVRTKVSMPTVTRFCIITLHRSMLTVR